MRMWHILQMYKDKKYVLRTAKMIYVKGLVHA